MPSTFFETQHCGQIGHRATVALPEIHLPCHRRSRYGTAEHSQARTDSSTRRSSVKCRPRRHRITLKWVRTERIFDAQRPFTIDVSNSGSATQGSSATPGVSGPATLNRDSDSAPIFNVNRAGAPYYIFEIASDASLFSNQNARTSSNFYGSYNDPGEPSRLTSASFTLPDPAWQNLKSADTLYYRIGTTTSQTGWDNYTASTTDDQASSAPSIAVSGAKSVPVETYAAKAA